MCIIDVQCSPGPAASLASERLVRKLTSFSVYRNMYVYIYIYISQADPGPKLFLHPRSRALHQECSILKPSASSHLKPRNLQLLHPEPAIMNQDLNTLQKVEVADADVPQSPQAGISRV